MSPSDSSAAQGSKPRAASALPPHVHQAEFGKTGKEAGSEGPNSIGLRLVPSGRISEDGVGLNSVGTDGGLEGVGYASAVDFWKRL